MLSLILLLPAVAGAQPFGPPPPPDSARIEQTILDLKATVKITEAQATTIRAILKDNSAAMQSIRGRREEFNFELGHLGHLNSLKGDLTARENLKFLAGLRTTLTPETIDSTLDRVGIQSRGDLPARSLSAGQKRRLALARLLLAGATLWVLDEPVTNLDTAGINLVEELITEHVTRGGLALSAAHQRLLDEASFLRRLERTL